ncbi:MAG: hypothetical protein LBG52_00360 [Candidatus Peribacteria bacterium]|jgi:hypothetical protein|nr:hypothetical protein [Candidatus Peribacteria bacterium]
MTLTEGGYVPHTILVFMPQLLNSYPVWDPLTDKQLGIHGRYTVWKNQLALDNIDMAQYEYTNYPTLPKEDILQDFTLGVKKLDAPEVVYLMKNIDDETYYVP